MTSKPLAFAAALCSLLAFSPIASASCLNTVWSTLQTRADGPAQITSIQTLDFDEDGKLDLVGLILASNGGNGVLNVWRGLGDGTFAAPVSLGTSNLNYVEVGDLNNDGHTDLVMTTSSGSLVVRFGNGVNFDAPVMQPLDYIPSQPVIVHLDSDPWADLVMLGTSANLVVTYRGDGTGHFTEMRRTATAPFPSALAAADFDGDGLMDIAYGLLASYGEASSINVIFQRPDGSFESPLVMPIPSFPGGLAIGDFDEDGRPDLVAAIWNADSHRVPRVIVFRNTGARNFERNDLASGAPHWVGNMTSVRVADMNGDHHADIVAASVNGGNVLTYTGKGDGTFRSPTYYLPSQNGNYSLALGDFDNDHVPDLALSGYQTFTTARSSCGPQVSLYTVSPLITQGAAAPLRALVSGLAANTPLPLGTVTFHEGAVTLGTAPVDVTGLASLDASGLSPGAHTLTASFGGNSEEASATSQSIVQTVTTNSTTTNLILPAAQSVYGTPYTVGIEVHAQAGFLIEDCENVLIVDGVEAGECGSPYFHPLSLTPGPHTLTAVYNGTINQPASTSGPQMITTAKATPAIAYVSGDLTVRLGNAHTLQFSISGPSGTVSRTGSVQLMLGNTLVGTGAVTGNLATVSATLPRGENDVVAIYSGDANFTNATTPLRLSVLPNVPLAIHAYSLQNAISIRSVLPDNTTSAALYRRVNGNGGWQLVPGWSPQTEFDNNGLVRGVLYDYRLDATVASVVQSSNIDSSLLFTDDPIVAGVTLVKRVHFDESRLLVNVLRASAGLSPFSFDGTYASPAVRATHLESLRNALIEARQALGMPAPSFTDGATQGTRVKAIHLTELRQQSQ
jgi:hypothetical protein